MSSDININLIININISPNSIYVCISFCYKNIFSALRIGNLAFFESAKRSRSTMAPTDRSAMAMAKVNEYIEKNPVGIEGTIMMNCKYDYFRYRVYLKTQFL